MEAKSKKVKSVEKRPAPRRVCPLCRKYARPAPETIEASREAEEIGREIVAGRRRPMTFDEYLAEVAAL